MEYSFKTKMLDGDIRLSPLQAKIFEIVLKEEGYMIRAEDIIKIIKEEVGIIVTMEHLRIQIYRINQKSKGLIKNRPCHGYYIDKEIKFS